MDSKYLEQIYAAAVAGTITDGKKATVTAGTRVQLVATVTPCRVVLITAKDANTDYVAVGGATVVAASGSTGAGILLAPGQSVTIGIDDLSKLYLDSRVNGEGIAYAYLS